MAPVKVLFLVWMVVAAGAFVDCLFPSLSFSLCLSGALCLSSLCFFLLVLRACNLLLHALLLVFFCLGRCGQRPGALACN